MTAGDEVTVSCAEGAEGFEETPTPATLRSDDTNHEDTTMKPLPYRYDVHLTGGPSGYAQVSSAGIPALRTAPPADYGSPGDAWSPEHLLLASVQSCFLFTFRAIARLSKLEFVTLEVVAAGTVDRQDGVTRSMSTDRDLGPSVTRTASAMAVAPRSTFSRARIGRADVCAAFSLLVAARPPHLP